MYKLAMTNPFIVLLLDSDVPYFNLPIVSTVAVVELL